MEKDYAEPINIREINASRLSWLSHLARRDPERLL